MNLMGQRIDDEIREQELKEKAERAAHIEKILTPEGFAKTMEARNEPIWKQIEKLQERITKLEALVQGHPHDDTKEEED